MYELALSRSGNLYLWLDIGKYNATTIRLTVKPHGTSNVITKGWDRFPGDWHKIKLLCLLKEPDIFTGSENLPHIKEYLKEQANGINAITL